jgi:hypothetical protein
MARLRGGEFNHLNPPTIAFVNKNPSNPTQEAPSRGPDAVTPRRLVYSREAETPPLGGRCRHP